MQNFSNRLSQAITASEKPKGALAGHTGVALSTVSRWLGGTVPKAETLDLIASFLGVDAKWLLTGHVSPEVPRSPSASSSASSAPPRFASPLPALDPAAAVPELLAVLERIATALEKIAKPEK